VTEDVDKEALGKAITIRRVELGLSRNQLRDRSGLSYPYVAELEKGKKSASGRALSAIASALEMRPHELLARAETLAASEEVQGSSNRPSGPSGWFGPAPAAMATGRLAPPPQVAPPGQPLTEARVRQIVREELRRLASDSDD
jgi:transcriptional regulator with XRE-family HTH domain